MVVKRKLIENMNMNIKLLLCFGIVTMLMGTTMSVSAQPPSTPQNDVIVRVLPESQTGMPGDTLTYNVNLTNNGTVDDIIVVDLITGVPSGWTVELKDAGVPQTLPYQTPLLQSKMSYPLTSDVHIPGNATAGASMTINIYSYADNSKKDSDTFDVVLGVICVNTTGWWRDGGTFNASSTPVQHAVNNASAGGNICVKDGTYNENVDAGEQLTIRSENGSENCIVHALNPSEHVFKITANWVNISGFTVEGAIGAGKAGIYLNEVDHCNITNNTVKSNYYGIYLWNADNNNITCNWVTHNEQRGFYLRSGSTDNNISHNNIMTNGVYNETSGGYEWNFYNNQTDIVEAENNYWVATDSETIDASIYDDEEGKGKVEFHPFKAGSVPCAPIPELPTIILFSMGLLTLAGYIGYKRIKDK